jgi:hypothetical protein
MSLRIFHIIFVMTSVALCVWVAAWGIRGYMGGQGLGALALGIVFLVSGVALVVYGLKVYVKLRDLP